MTAEVPDNRPEAERLQDTVRDLKTGNAPPKLFELFDTYLKIKEGGEAVSPLMKDFREAMAAVIAKNGMPFAEKETYRMSKSQKYRMDVQDVLRSIDLPETISAEAMRLALKRMADYAERSWPPDATLAGLVHNAVNIHLRVRGAATVIHEKPSRFLLLKTLPAIIFDYNRNDIFWYHFEKALHWTKAELRSAAAEAVRRTLESCAKKFEGESHKDVRRAMILQKEYHLAVATLSKEACRTILSRSLYSNKKDIESFMETFGLLDTDLQVAAEKAIRSNLEGYRTYVSDVRTLIKNYRIAPEKFRPAARKALPHLFYSENTETLYGFATLFGIQKELPDVIPQVKQQLDSLHTAEADIRASVNAGKEQEPKNGLEAFCAQFSEQNKGSENGKHAKLALMLRLEQYGLDATDVLNAWKSIEPEKMGNDKKDLSHVLYHHLLCINTLEATVQWNATDKGPVRTLYEEFGIRNFGRYQTKTLQRQYEQRNKTDMPYGAMVFPTDDYNTAFFLGTKIENFSVALQKTGRGLRIVEARSTKEVKKRLLSLHRRYHGKPSETREAGHRHKFSFAVIGGHGTERTISFGGFRRDQMLHIDDIGGLHKGHTEQFFEPRPTIVLISCSTGAEKGIAEELSKKLEATVAAPTIPTNIKEIVPNERPDGSLELQVTYWEEKSSQIYHHDQAQEQQKNPEA